MWTLQFQSVRSMRTLREWTASSTTSVMPITNCTFWAVPMITLLRFVVRSHVIVNILLTRVFNITGAFQNPNYNKEMGCIPVAPFSPWSVQECDVCHLNWHRYGTTNQRTVCVRWRVTNTMLLQYLFTPRFLLSSPAPRIRLFEYGAKQVIGK